MSRLTEYLAVVAIGLAIVMFVIVPIQRATVQAMDNAANLIAERN